MVRLLHGLEDCIEISWVTGQTSESFTFDKPEPEFEAILDVIDPNRDGQVSLQEYMAFMISKETENVQSSEEIENAFRAISAQERDYVTKDELYHNLTREMADYCMRKMRPYVDPNTGHEVNDAYDYLDFTSKLFQKS